MDNRAQQFEELLRPTVNAMGYILWGCEYIPRKHQGLLRVYIDSPNGIEVDDCVSVSRQISGLLDVEDVLAGAYTLEVSSPGLSRKFFTPEQMKDYIGQTVKVQLKSPLQDRKKWVGTLTALDGEELCLLVDGETQKLPLSEIDKAQLVL